MAFLDTTQKVVDYFLVLQDKYGSPSVDEDEAVNFLNHALQEYLNRIFPDNQGAVVNFEQDKNVTANIQPLVFDFTLNTTAGGLLTTAAINAALVTAGAEAGATYFRIGSIGLTSGGITYPVKYMRDNNFWAFNRNYFKKPLLTRPKFELVATGVQVYPVGTQALTVSVVKKPKTLDLSTPVNPEFGDYQMVDVLMIALQLAGVSTRDEEILNDIRNNTIQAK
jgi:hypothetical protein